MCDRGDLSAAGTPPPLLLPWHYLFAKSTRHRFDGVRQRAPGTWRGIEHHVLVGCVGGHPLKVRRCGGGRIHSAVPADSYLCRTDGALIVQSAQRAAADDGVMTRGGLPFSGSQTFARDINTPWRWWPKWARQKRPSPDRSSEEHSHNIAVRFADAFSEVWRTGRFGTSPETNFQTRNRCEMASPAPENPAWCDETDRPRKYAASGHFLESRNRGSIERCAEGWYRFISRRRILAFFGHAHMDFLVPHFPFCLQPGCGIVWAFAMQFWALFGTKTGLGPGVVRLRADAGLGPRPPR